MTEYGFWAAMLVGLLGGGHCLGMCGGIVGAFSRALPNHGVIDLQQRIAFVLAYNGGRIFSYTLAGILVGFASGMLAALFQLDAALSALQLLAAVMLVLLGLYISQLFRGLAYLEQLGRPLWQRLSPLAQRLLPLHSPGKAFVAGTLWGWLPCGLVYSTLTWALASADPIQGGLIMAGFGLGTLPALLAMGAAADLLERLLNNKKFRFLSGLVLIAYGVQMAYIALSHLL
ncbi:sulfite exporter TauE/SafE family protein [Ferrimonas gelatinilytica]|uniref:Sulfite exporter TauE/SafE family protein n=1 Tax=Ferrimonas gelatinilytica TaxID=1255257 RepID=A0ABP9RVQ2_9GAMM